MAKLEKSRARKPLAESTLNMSASGQGGAGRYTSFTCGAHAYDSAGRLTFYTLRMNREEAEKLSAYLARMLATELDGYGNAV